MTKQAPTVGRIVLLTVAPDGVNNHSDVAPAIVTRVWGDEARDNGSWLINVRAFLDGRESPWHTSIALWPDRDARDEAAQAWAEATGSDADKHVAAYWPPRS